MDINSSDALKAAVALLSASWAMLTGWAKYRLRRIDRRMDSMENNRREDVRHIREEIREGFKGVHERLDRHIEREK